MKARWSALVITMMALTVAGLAQQQPAPGTPTALPSPPAREPAWAFPVIRPAAAAGAAGTEAGRGQHRRATRRGRSTICSTRPTGFPTRTSRRPRSCRRGTRGALACGACHLMSGFGHPESADLTGFTADYFIQQMADFKAGVRKDYARMNGIAKELSDQEIREAAEWFASLPRGKLVRVVEAAMVPKTFVGQGRMRFIDPKNAGMEPIGTRIIMLPEDQEKARLRDPRSGFVAYVPPGSLAKGRALANGGGGKTVACAICHGDGLKGLANVPRLAGLHPIYVARQLHLFKEGDRSGPDAPLMKKPVAEPDRRRHPEPLGVHRVAAAVVCGL